MEKQREIEALLSHNVEEVIEKEHLRKTLESGKKLRVKLGIDPTSPDLHLGHAVVMRKLRAFQDAGHTIVLIIGDFTARIGDPTGRSEARKPLSKEQVNENMGEYLAQAAKIINIEKAEVHRNSAWFETEGIQQFVQLSMAGTFQQVLRRADFKKRLEADQDITFLELLYPLFQGYDSVKVKADLEVGGTDQKFNLLMGRRVQRHFDMAEQDIMTFPLLEGLDGVKKMSKSLGNYVGLTDQPNDMFGKIMSIPDTLMEKYFHLCTDITPEEVDELKKGLGPKELKERLGFEIVKIYQGADAAMAAKENFERIFSKKEAPNDLSELALPQTNMSALEVALASKIFKSKGEARRLIEQGGFEYAGETVIDPQKVLILSSEKVLRIGKKHFFKVRI